jgi:muconolactone delta-isomerase
MMLFMLHSKLAKPEGMSNKEFYGVWEQEAEAAVAALKAGVIKALYKVPGTPEVVSILDVNTADDVDHAVHSLPIWKLGYSHIVAELKWTPLRLYENWAEDLKKLAREE